MDLDLRLVRAFAAVAKSGHFGRAAEELKITQPALSRQVRRLEQQLGVILLSRTSRHVELTLTGREFLDEIQPVLDAADQAVVRAQLTRSGVRTLTVGFMGGIVTQNAVTAFAAAHPEIEVALRHMEWWDQAESLRDRRVDVAFVRPPIDTTGLQVIDLYTEPRVVLLPSGHPLANSPSLSIMDVASEPVVVHRSNHTDWDAYWTIDPRPDGSHPRRRGDVQTVEEKLEQVATGTAVAFMPASAAAYYTHKGVQAVQLHDVDPCHIAIAWPKTHRSPAAATFARAAKDATSGPPPSNR